MEKIRKIIRAFIVDNFLFGVEDENFTNTISLLQTGFVDSTGFLEIVTFIEDEFGFKIDDNELVPDNFDSLENITSFITRRLNSQKEPIE